MSGWIKLEKDRRDDPRVLRMARQLRDAGVTHERYMPAIHVTLVLGCLDVLWCYADTHARDDDTLDLSVEEIDELVGLKGFCELMPSDWLEVLDPTHVKLPEYQSHNGTEAKKRALTQKRMERHRNAPASQIPKEVKRKSVTPASPDQDQDQDQDQTKSKSALRAHVMGLNAQAWDRWEAYRKDMKKPLREASIEEAQRQLAKHPPDVQLAMVTHSIAQGYQGLFEPKSNANRATPARKPARSADEIEAEERAKGITP